MTKQLKEVTGYLKGKTITEVISGGGNGSIIILNIGQDKEYCLFIYSTWRIEHYDKVIATWNDASDSDVGNLLLETKLLEGDTIIDLFLGDFYDLKIYLKSKKVLNVFCDISSIRRDKLLDKNWTICDKNNNKCYKITDEYEVETIPFSNKNLLN